MNRIEFMAELSRLLEGIPEEDRLDALNYYNDYFDDAGSENEQNVIEELESPEKVAMKIKAERGDIEVVNIKSTEAGKEEEAGSGYQYYQESKEETGYREKNVYYDNGTYTYDNDNPEESEADKPWTSKPLKYLLIAAIILVGCPVIVPLAAALVVTVLALVIAAFAVFASIVIAFAAVVLVGVVLLCSGIGSLISSGVVGLGIIGIGLIVIPIGLIGTIAGIRLCTIVFPGMIRGIVCVCRKPFHRRTEV